MIRHRVRFQGNKNYIICRTGKIFSRTSRQYISRVGSSGSMVVDIDGKTRLIARLIAQAFLENPDGHPAVIHLNHKKHDCRPRNLKWVSRSEAILHRQSAPKKNPNCSHPHTDETRADMRLQHRSFKGWYCKDGQKYRTLAEAARETGEKNQHIKTHTMAGTGGWSFTAYLREVTSSTFLQDPEHPESSF